MNWDKSAKVAFSSLSRILTSGDSDDFAKIILTAEGQPTVDIEVNSVDAYTGDYIFKVFGSKGTLMSTNEKYQMKYIEDFSAYPERPVIFDTMRDEKGDPTACSEKLEFVEESGAIKGSVFSVAVRDFYQMIYDTLFEGKALIITPEMAAETVRIIEACHAENPLSVEFE
jgi:predicted dehydrogenase